MPAWPASLPQKPLINTLRLSPENVIAAAEPETGGPPVRRARSLSAGDTVSATWGMDATQRATFETFFKTTLKGGSLTFTMPNPVDGGTGTYLFLAAPVIAHVYAKHYRISADLYLEAT